MDIYELRELAEERLKEIFDTEQIEEIRYVYGRFFEEILIKQKEFNDNLSQRVLEKEIFDNINYDIYCGLIEKEDLFLYNDIFTPMIEEDMSQDIMPIELLKEYFSKKINFTLTKIYLELPLNEIKNIKKREFFGKIYTKTGEYYEFKIKLEQDKRYKEKERELYEGFLLSGRKWKTILNPFGKRFFFVKVIKFPEILPDDIEIEKITFDLEEFNDLKKENKICIWNVWKTEIKTQGFPIELGNNFGYEFNIPLDERNKNGYIFTSENKSIINVTRDDEFLKVRTFRVDIKKWNSFEIKNISRLKNNKIQENLYCNKKLKDIVEIYKEQSIGTIRTKAEMNRFISVYEISKNITIKDVILKNYRENILGNEIEIQENYVREDIRNDKKTNILKIIFKLKDGSTKFIYDFIEFLLSELSIYFPEYKCIGEVISYE
ncbi:MAG: hypothetical protein PWP46_2122 [Fusobacteriaceae bacterium]|jgi:hypothetical protein|nr:hypothetical protein [Fusobacteriaceae bacterium]